jgi:hypothetical protein
MKILATLFFSIVAGYSQTKADCDSFAALFKN